VAALLAVLGSLPGLARAEGFALETFRPPPAGDRFFSIESAEVAGHGIVSVALMTVLGTSPLLLTPHGTGEPTALVSEQVSEHLGVGLALWNRLKLSVDLPLSLAHGEDVGAHAAPSGWALADIGAGARLVVLGGRDRPYRLALAGHFWFPNGDEARFAGDGELRGGAQMLLSGRAGAFLWGLASGVALRPVIQFEDTTLGDQLTFGAAVGGLIGRLQLSAELAGAAGLRGDDAFAGSTTNLELVLGAKYRIGPMVAGPALGPGLAGGVGTPTVRAAMLIAFAPLPRKHPTDEGPTPPPLPPGPNPVPAPGPDGDGDGVPDADDACPDRPGPRSDEPSQSGCPLADRDGDGVPDRDDVCPFAKGSASPDPKRNGCPADADGDMILDGDDACPTVKGVMSVDRQKNGCPPDTDGDGARDDLDACPKEKGPPDPDRTRNGCPTKLRVTEQAIELLEEVAFVNDADVAPASEELMKQIAGALADHPEVKRVAIEVHPSPGDKGSGAKRATSIKAKLTSLGVPAGRLVTRSVPAPDPGRPVVELRIEDPRPAGEVAVPQPGPKPVPKP